MKPNPKSYEGLLKVQDNKNNTLTKEKIILGKELYFDAILSQNRDISCNSCHTIEKNKTQIIIPQENKNEKIRFLFLKS